MIKLTLLGTTENVVHILDSENPVNLAFHDISMEDFNPRGGSSCTRLSRLRVEEAFGSKIMLAHYAASKRDIVGIRFMDGQYAYYNHKTGGYIAWIQARGSKSVEVHFCEKKNSDWINEKLKYIFGDDYSPKDLKIFNYEDLEITNFLERTDRLEDKMYSHVTRLLPVWWLDDLDGLMLLPDIGTRICKWLGEQRLNELRYIFLEETTDLAARVFRRLVELKNKDVVDYLESYVASTQRSLTQLSDYSTPHLVNLNDFFDLRPEFRPHSYYIDMNAPEPYLYFHFKGIASTEAFYQASAERMKKLDLINDWVWHSDIKLALRIEGNIGMSLDEFDLETVRRYLNAHGIKSLTSNI